MGELGDGFLVVVIGGIEGLVLVSDVFLSVVALELFEVVFEVEEMREAFSDADFLGFDFLREVLLCVAEARVQFECGLTEIFAAWEGAAELYEFTECLLFCRVRETEADLIGELEFRDSVEL